MAVPSKAWVCGCSLLEIADSNTVEGTDMFLVSIMWCQVEVSE
jgi:hypothetical protein